jgi:hypothetical protein
MHAFAIGDLEPLMEVFGHALGDPTRHGAQATG